MKGELYLDTENIFYSLRTSDRKQQLPPATDAQLFGADNDTSLVRKAGKIFDLLTSWYREHAKADPLEVHSYGQNWDPGVKALLLALTAEEESFARVVNAGNAEQEVDPNLRLGLYHRNGARTLHHSVGAAQHAAEQKLVKDLLIRLQDPAPASYLVGSADHDALFPLDHAVLERPTLDAWVLLPATSRVWRRFRLQGSYPHIPSSRVFTLDEVLRSSWTTGGRLKKARQGLNAYDMKRITAARESAGLPTEFTHDNRQQQRRLEGMVARLIGIHESNLVAARPGSPKWRNAIGADWLLDAANTSLFTEVSESERESVLNGTIAAPRLAQLIRAAGVRHLLHTEDAETVCSLIFGLTGLTSDYRAAAAACVEVMLRADSQAVAAVEPLTASRAFPS